LLGVDYFGGNARPRPAFSGRRRLATPKGYQRCAAESIAAAAAHMDLVHPRKRADHAMQSAAYKQEAESSGPPRHKHA